MSEDPATRRSNPRKQSVYQASVREVSEDGDFASVREARKVHERERAERKFARIEEDGNGTEPDYGQPPRTLSPLSDITTDRHQQIRAELFHVIEKGSTMEAKSLLFKAESYVPLYHTDLLDATTGQNVLHFALKNSRLDIVEIILSAHGDKKLLQQAYTIPKSTRSTLHQITEMDNTALAKQFLDKFPSRSEKIAVIKLETLVDIQGQRPRLFSSYHLAAFKGFTELINLYLDAGIAIDSVNGKKDTALLWAARWGHLKTVNCLLDRQADVSLENDKKSTALYWAVRYQKYEIMKLLLGKGRANPNQTRLLGLVAPIVIACALGNNMIVTELINHGADVNTIIRGGEMPLHHASKEGHVQVVHTLLMENAILNAEDEKGDSALILAAQNGHADVVQLLLKNGADMYHKNHIDIDAWYCAITQDDDGVLHVLTDQYTYLRAKKRKMKSPLCIAASLGKSAKLKTLMDMKVDPEERDEDGSTFLHHAAINDQSEIIRKFHKKVNIDAQNNNKETALHLACNMGNRNTILELIDKKAKSNVGNSNGENALHVVAHSTATTPEIARAVMEHTIKIHDWESVNAMDDNGNNALHIAGKSATPDVLWEFRFVRIKDTDVDGNTPLHEAVMSGKEEVLETALDIYENMQRDADINTLNNKSESVLHLATAKGFSNSVTRLVFYGADLTCTDSDGNTVLHRLVRYLADDKDRLDVYMKVLENILHDSVRWWSNFQKVPYPGKNKNIFKEMQRNALLALVNDYNNKDNLSVLAYAFKLGSHDFLGRFLTMPDVMMFRVEDKIYFDVTHLTSSTNQNVARCCGAAPGQHASSHIELLMTVDAKGRASRVLDVPPVRQVERMYTAICAWAYAFFMLLHIIYMAVFSYLGVTIASKFREIASGIPLSNTDSSLVASFVIVPIEPAIALMYVFLALVRCIRRKERIQLRSAIAIMFLLLFACLTLAWLIMIAKRDSNQDYVLAVCLCLGWINSISLTRGFKGIHYFFKMLVNMIVRDVLRFLVVFSFVLLAFGFALHVVFQISPDIVDTYSNPADTLFMTFNLMIGMAELFDDDFETGMSGVGRTATFAKVIYLVYILLSTIVLLNLLIAMMNDSYSDILLHQRVTWRVESIQIGIGVENLFPWLPSIFGKITIKKQTFPITENSSKEERWYLVTDEFNLEKYASEDSHDDPTERLTSTVEKTLHEVMIRVEHIENKVSDTRQKLEEIIELVKNLNKKQNSEPSNK